jgi:hypothetical protein
MKPSWMAPPRCLAPSCTALKPHGAAAALLCLAVAGVITVAATSAGAAPLPSCRADRAVYVGANEPNFEIEFFRDFTAKKHWVKSGVMRILLASGAVDYDVLTAWSPSYANPMITIRRSVARSRKGDEHREVGPRPLLLFDANLRPHRGHVSAPAVLIMEDIPAWFANWPEEQERAFAGERIVPPYAFKLVRCRGRRTLAIALAATSAGAGPFPCRDDHALYRPTTNERYELEFFRSLRGSRTNRAGILRYRGEAGVFEYEFAITWSAGFPRPSLVIIENSSAPRNPEEDDNELKIVDVASTMITLAEDFGPLEVGWPRYLVFPDMTVFFRAWFKELAKHPDQPPPQAWKLVACRSDADAAAKPSAHELGQQPRVPTSAPVLWWRYQETRPSWQHSPGSSQLPEGSR